MSAKNREVDIVDCQITSIDNLVDAFSQYPLLAGEKKYTVELTEFVSPLAGHGPLPILNSEKTAPLVILEVRRKNVGVQPGHDNTRLTTLAAPLGGPQGTFNDNSVLFRRNAQRPMETPGDVAYQLQRYFDDIRAKYIPADPNAMEVARAAYQTQQDIATDPDDQYSAAAQQAAQDLIDGDPNAVPPVVGLLETYLAFGPFRGSDHGGGPDVPITTNNRFVTVAIGPNGVLSLSISPFFGKHFFITFSKYGSLLLGLVRKENILAVAEDDNAVTSGILALTGQAALGHAIVAGESTQTVEFRGDYSLEQHFDHRVRIEVESQMNTPTTVAWTTKGIQKMSHIIATFPIATKTQSSVLLNNEGVPTRDVRYQTDVLLGDITWRKAEDKVSERYVLQDSQFFHNIRLEVFMVRKEYSTTRDEFDFAKEKMVYSNGESWTAKLRFRSI